MAEHQNLTQTDAISRLERDAAQLVIKVITEKHKEVVDLDSFKTFLRTKSGESTLTKIADIATEEKGRIMVNYKDEDLMKKTCKDCYRRGFTGHEVKFQSNAQGKYSRDANGQPIEISRQLRLCKCVKKHIQPIKGDYLKGWAETEYERQTKQADKQTPAKDKAAPKKRVAKAKATTGDSKPPKAAKPKG